MKLLRVIILLFLLVGVASAQTGAPPFPTSPTLGEEVTGPNGQVYKWDGTKWVAGVAPFVPPDGSLWTTTGLTGVASLGVNGAVTIGGNLNVAGITSHAQIVSPTIAVTGNLQIAAGANLLFAGFPMGGTCPVGEYVNALSGTGQLTCQPIVGGGGVFVGTAPPASPTAGQLWFNSTDLQTYMWYTDPTSSQWVAVVNMGGSGGGGGPWLPVNNPTYTGLMTGPTLNLTNVTGSSIYWGSATAPNASINAYAPSGINVAAGAHSNAAGNWIADSTTATIRSNEASGAIGYYLNTGLTIGSTFTPTELGWWGSNGLNMTTDIQLYNTTSTSLYWGSMTAPDGSLTGLGSGLMVAGGAHYNGTTWVVDLPNSGIITLGNGGATVYGDTGLTVGNTFTPTELGYWNAVGLNLVSGVYQINGVTQPNWSPGVSYCHNTFNNIPNGGQVVVFQTGVWGASSAGFLTVSNTFSGAISMTLYGVASFGSGSSQFSVIQHSDYGGGAAPFTLSVAGNPDMSANYVVTNTSGQTTSVYYWYTPVGGPNSVYCR